MYPIILAGGQGTRLWPVSRKTQPKQVQPFLDKESLLEKTYKRLKKGFPKSKIFVVTSKSQENLVRKQLKILPKNNLIQEAKPQGTAAAFGLGLVYVLNKNKQAVVVYINSDNYISREKEYLRILRVAENFVKENPKSILLIGVNPTYPEIGYGYIKMGSSVKKIRQDEIFFVEKFVEKPDLKTAKKYLKKWEYLWNPTLIIVRADWMLHLYKKFMPDTYRHLEKICDLLERGGNLKNIDQEYQAIKKDISIDYGILEKIKKDMFVLPANFGWADIGHWRMLKDILSKKEDDNIVKGRHIHYDSFGNLIYSLSDKLVATIGVKNMIIIETGDVILICPKERAQEVKRIVRKLEKEGLNKYL